MHLLIDKFLLLTPLLFLHQHQLMLRLLLLALLLLLLSITRHLLLFLSSESLRLCLRRGCCLSLFLLLSFLRGCFALLTITCCLPIRILLHLLLMVLLCTQCVFLSRTRLLRLWVLFSLPHDSSLSLSLSFFLTTCYPLFTV